MAFAHTTTQPIAKLSPFFNLATQKPWEPGVYSVRTAWQGKRASVYSYWDGLRFNYLTRDKDKAFEMRAAEGCGSSVIEWAGLAAPVAPAGTPNRLADRKPPAPGVYRVEDTGIGFIEDGHLSYWDGARFNWVSPNPETAYARRTDEGGGYRVTHWGEAVQHAVLAQSKQPIPTMPVKPGVYRVFRDATREIAWYSFWDGAKFNWLSTSKEGALSDRANPGGGEHVTHWEEVTTPITMPGFQRGEPAPRYISESTQEAAARVPALAPLLAGEPTGQNAAAVFDLVDSKPGYTLVTAVIPHGRAAEFVFRRT